MTSFKRPSRALDNPPLLIACSPCLISSELDGQLGAASRECATPVADAISAAEMPVVFKNVRRSNTDVLILLILVFVVLVTDQSPQDTALFVFTVFLAAVGRHVKVADGTDERLDPARVGRVGVKNAVAHAKEYAHTGHFTVKEPVQLCLLS
jgi:hypothetical protein